MKYLTKLSINTKAKKYVKKLDKNNQKRILDAIEKLRYIPPEGDVRAMQGKHRGIYRCRVGDVRIIFYQDIDADKLVILMIGSRGQVYKNL